MKLHVAAVGRLRKGPELELFSDYRTRIAKSGKPLGLGPLEVSEVDGRKAQGPPAEAAALEPLIPQSAYVVALDERGSTLSSPQLADLLSRQRDSGQPSMAFVIGGADGLDPAFRDRADMRLSFGAMVWPHMLVRVMLAEQLYRAVSIVAGTPYHRV